MATLDSPDVIPVTLPSGERFLLAEMTGRDYRAMREVQARGDEAAALDTMLDILERRVVGSADELLDLPIRKLADLVEAWMAGVEEAAVPAEERKALAASLSRAAVDDKYQPSVPLATRSTSSRNGGQRTPRGSSR
jgi:hypothetical protein